MKHLIGNIMSGEQIPVEESIVYSVFRIVVALLFMQHGAQKLLGAFGGIDGSGAVVDSFSLLWFAGAIELLGGGMIAIGLFSRLAVIPAIVAMTYAYFIVHLPANLFPILNRGELALMYLFSFLMILKAGNGRFSLEQAWFKKEIF